MVHLCHIDSEIFEIDQEKVQPTCQILLFCVSILYSVASNMDAETRKEKIKWTIEVCEGLAW